MKQERARAARRRGRRTGPDGDKASTFTAQQAPAVARADAVPR